MTLPPDPAPEPAPPTAPVMAQADFILQYRERVRLFALRRLGNVAAAEDVAQETLRRVWEALQAGRVQNLVALPSFAFQTAEHLCLQHYRSAGREARALDRLTRTGDRPSGGWDALLGLVRDEERRAVQEALTRLAPEDHELLRLVYFEGHDAAALAERLGITAGAFRVRKHRALRRLAELLEDLTR